MEATRRTWNDQGYKKNMQHATLGLISEVGELTNQIKKNVGYGKELDKINVKEELGDLLFFLMRIVDENHLPISIIETVAIEYSSTDDSVGGLSALMESSLKIGYALHESTNTAAIIKYSGKLLAQINDWCGEEDWTIEQVCITNIAKLYGRFPEKFSTDQALTRNLEAEYEILKTK